MVARTEGEGVSEQTCDVRGCDAVTVATAVLEWNDRERSVGLCANHVRLAYGGAIFAEYLKPISLCSEIAEKVQPDGTN